MSKYSVNPLSYVGVRAGTPPNFMSYNRAPTANDYKDYYISDIWHQKATENMWVLTKKDAGVATWTAFAGTGNFDDIVVDPGDITVVQGDVYINNGGLQLGAINYPSTLRTLADGTVYGLADDAAPGVGEGSIYHTNSSGVAQWGDLTSTGGTVTITTSVDGINLEAGGGVGAATFTTDDLNVVVPTAGGNLFVAGGDNINTTGAIANTYTVNLDTSIHQPATNASGTEGLYTLDGDDFMHAYGTENTFLGEDAGNRTLVSSQDNVGIGTETLWNLTTGNDNTGVGHNAGTEITTGDSNVAIGESSLLSLETGDENCAVGDLSLSAIVSGSNNTALGSQAGVAHTAADSSNIDIGNAGVLGESNTIRIGTQGSGAGQQDAAYIAGVYGVAVSTTQYVRIDANGKLGTDAGGGGGTGNIPVGGMVDFSGVTPANFLECDGSAIDQVTYATLYGAIGHKYVRYDFSAPVTPGYYGGKPVTFTKSFSGVWLVGTSGGMMYSTNDGVSWATSSLPYGLGTNSITSYGGLAAVSATGSGVGSYVYTSPDGINWTLRLTVSGSAAMDMMLGNDGAGNWTLACSNTASYYSLDGITWVPGGGLPSDYKTVYTSLYNQEIPYGNGLYSIGRVKSSDGITWTASGLTSYITRFHDGYFYNMYYGKSTDYSAWTSITPFAYPYAFNSSQPGTLKSTAFKWLDDTYAPFWISASTTNLFYKSFDGFSYEVWQPVESPYSSGWTDSNITDGSSFHVGHNGLDKVLFAYRSSSSSRVNTVAGTAKDGTDLTTDFFVPYKPNSIIRYQ